jgi:hypothetical protein
MASSISIRPWDPSTLAPDATCLAVGKRHSGKTTLMIDIMYHLKDKLDFCMGMNGTENSSTPTLGRFLPSTFVYNHYHEEKVKHLLEWQRRSVANGKGMRAGLILDDLMGETNSDGTKRKIMSSGEIGKIFKIGRHRKIFFWCTLQYMRDCPPDARNNTDVLFLYNMTSPSERTKVYKDFFGMLKTQNDFNSVLDACTEGYSCLVLDTLIAMRDPANSLFFYKADLHPEDFKLGKQVFFTLSDHYFQDRSDNDMSVQRVLGIDPSSSGTKCLKRSGGIVINKLSN